MGSDDTANANETEDETKDSRQFGVELGSLEKELEEHEYPTTSVELIEEYGEHEVELPNGPRTFEEVLGIMAQDELEYESTEEVRQDIYNAVGSDAVGREAYSDRAGMYDDEDSTESQESL